MPTIEVDLPDDVFSSLRRSPSEVAQEMRFAAAGHWYHQGLVSQEKAALIAGMDRTDFLLRLAREKQDVFRVDFEDLETELGRG